VAAVPADGVSACSTATRKLPGAAAVPAMPGSVSMAAMLMGGGRGPLVGEGTALADTSPVSVVQVVGQARAG
jgi:hypothetical protein